MELEHYLIDAEASRITVRPFASAAASGMAQNPTFTIRELSGNARLVPGTLDGASIQIRIKVSSLGITEQGDEQERAAIERVLHRDILEAQKYPEIVFSTSKVSASKAADGHYWINLLGDLRLHGVGRSEPVAVQVVVARDALFARGELTVAPSAYQIRPVALAGGVLRLRDEVKCVFDIVARKQPPQPSDPKKRMLAVEGS